MKAIVVGAGIGGLATALALHARGMEVEVYEQAARIRELGVGINTLPQAIEVLDGLGLLARLRAASVETSELIYQNRFGQEVWRENRGLRAGHLVPQLSIHRGRLQAILLAAATERLGTGAIQTDRRLHRFQQDGTGVAAWFRDAAGQDAATGSGDVLIGADGIHSVVRDHLNPGEGPPKWNGLLLWRGARDWPAFLDGSSMVVSGGLESKVVIYPIAAGADTGDRLTNWGVISRIGRPGDVPPRREDWSRPGSWDDLEPHIRDFRIAQTDVAALMRETPVFWEYPLCDRDPLPRWSNGRVTLLGDAAHPMYPVGSNGASQAILDAAALAEALASGTRADAALLAYEAARRPVTSGIVVANREGGPEGVIDAVEKLAPAGFADIEQVLPHAQREAIVRSRAGAAGLRTTPAVR